jgi:hypothetical protein
VNQPIQEWLDWMSDDEEQKLDLIHFSGFTPEMTDLSSCKYFLSLENNAPLCISFYKEDCTRINSNYGGLFYVQLTASASACLNKLIQKLADQFTIKSNAPRPFSKQPWRIDYGALSYFTLVSSTLGFYNLSDLQVFVRQTTPNLITYHKKPDFIRQVRQVLLDQNTYNSYKNQFLGETTFNLLDHIYRICVRISDIYIKDFNTVGINIDLVTLEMYHDKIKIN